MTSTGRSRAAASLGARSLGLCLTLAACAPSQFDRLGTNENAALDASDDGGTATDTGAADADMLDADTPDAESMLEAGEDAAPEDASPEDASPEAGIDEDACVPAPEGGRELVVAGPVVELARLSHPPSVRTRKLGPSAWLGAHRVWTFSETGLAGQAPPPAEAPVNYPSAALDGTDPPWLRAADDPPAEWRLADALTDAGAPAPLLTRTTGELGQALGLTVTSIVKTSPEGERGGLAFVRDFNGFLVPTQVWAADLADGSTLATRRDAPLFVAPDPLFAQGAELEDGYVKLFACRAETPVSGGLTTFPCAVARAPVAQAGERAAYEAYLQDEHGTGSWTADLTQASPVLYASDGELSVSWNEHLQKFVAVHSAYFSNDVILHTAPHMEGPWTEGVAVTLAAPPAWPALYAREHPSLQQRCGKRIILSHWAATSLGDNHLPNAGDIVLDAIDLE